MSAETYISEDNCKPIFDVLVVSNKKLIALERNSETHISWKGHIIGSLTPKINKHLMAYKKNPDSPKMSTIKNPTFTFDLTQIQVVSIQCNQCFI
jgi:hypothetical protein